MGGMLDSLGSPVRSIVPYRTRAIGRMCAVPAFQTRCERMTRVVTMDVILGNLGLCIVFFISWDISGAILVVWERLLPTTESGLTIEIYHEFNDSTRCAICTAT